MVCCTIVAGLLGLLLSPFAVFRSSPLAWRPGDETSRSASLRVLGARRVASFKHAFDGCRFLVIHETHVRIHLAIAALAIVLGIGLQITAAEWRWIIVAIALVLCAEALNTAIEQACNAVSTNFDPSIKAAKDAAAGGVLIVCAGALLTGASVFLPHVLQRANSGNQVLNGVICRTGAATATDSGAVSP